MSAQESAEARLLTALASDTFIFDPSRFSTANRRACKKALEWIQRQASQSECEGVEPGWEADTVRSRACVPWKLLDTVLPHAGSATAY